GLSPPVAAAIVTTALEQRVHDELRPQEKAERRTRLHRVASGILGLTLVLIGVWIFPARLAALNAVRILVVVAYIWFAQSLGSNSRYRYFARPTPASMIRLGAWILLILFTTQLFLAL